MKWVNCVRVILQTVDHKSTCSFYTADKAFLNTITTDLQRVSIVMKCGCDVDDVTTAITLKIVFPGTINFIGDSANTKEIPIYLVDSTS